MRRRRPTVAGVKQVSSPRGKRQGLSVLTNIHDIHLKQLPGLQRVHAVEACCALCLAHIHFSSAGWNYGGGTGEAWQKASAAEALHKHNTAAAVGDKARGLRLLRSLLRPSLTLCARKNRITIALIHACPVCSKLVLLHFRSSVLYNSLSMKAHLGALNAHDAIIVTTEGGASWQVRLADAIWRRIPSLPLHRPQGRSSPSRAQPAASCKITSEFNVYAYGLF